MTCDDVRDRLLARPADRTDPEIASHLGDCTACAAFVQRLTAFTEALPDHRAGIEPDPGFSARVVARLPDDATLLGWAAFRLLPLAATLALLLSWLAWTAPPLPGSPLGGDSGEALLAHLLAGQGDVP
jgi:hypothetical protein